MNDLTNHRDRGGDHRDRDHILEYDKELTEYHFRLSPERTPYHLDRFRRRSNDSSSKPDKTPTQPLMNQSQ